MRVEGRAWKPGPGYLECRGEENYLWAAKGLGPGDFPEAVGAGVLRAVADRVASLARRTGGRRFVLSGGVALNRGFARALAAALGCDVAVLPEPQFVGAYGAALLAGEG